jgi:hypothetical protein
MAKLGSRGFNGGNGNGNGNGECGTQQPGRRQLSRRLCAELFSVARIASASIKTDGPDRQTRKCGAMFVD